jgi:hypothetical protein
MNRTQVTLIVTGFILLALMATNPAIEDHREAVKELYKKKLSENNKEDEGDLGHQIGTGIASLIGDKFIDNIVSRENYLFFSVTKATFGSQTKKIGFGVLGKVFVSDYNKFSDATATKSETQLPKQNSVWVGKYNNYDSRLTNYMGFSYCNPGNVDIEIKQTENAISVIIVSKGQRMDVSYNTSTIYKVSESNEHHIVFSHKNDEIGMTFVFKIFKNGDRYFVKNITQEDCEDYEIVRSSM